MPRSHTSPRIVGVGIDLIEIDRVQAALDRWGRRLVERLMGPEERAIYDGEDVGRALGIARRIAVKEAASKALGTGWTRGVSWRHVVVSLTPVATFTLQARALEVAQRLGSEGEGSVATEDTADGLVYAEVLLHG
jgi:holo-[acyl-carrier protein] synthase